MAGSVVATVTKLGGLKRVALAWTSDAAGAVSGNAAGVQGGELEQVRFIPGSGGDQPTDLYDVTLTDAQAVDVLGGLGANLSNVNTTNVVPVVSTSYKRIIDAGDLTPVVANAGNTKKGTIVLYLR